MLGWVTKELQSTAIRDVQEDILESAVDRLDYVAVIHYDSKDTEDVKVVNAFEQVFGDDCKQHDIRVVKTSELLFTTGLEDAPVMVYHENDVPFLYPHHPLEADMADEAMAWLVTQRNTAAIEEVTDGKPVILLSICFE